MLRIFQRYYIYLKMAFAVCMGKPYKLTFLLVDGCNLRCKMCYIWQSKIVFLEKNKVLSLIKNFPGELCWINFSGGELLLHPDIVDIVIQLRNLSGHKLLTFTSNGFIHPCQQLQDALILNHSHFIYWTVSVDGPEQIHDTIRGRSGAYEKAMNSIKTFKEIQNKNKYFKVGVALTVSEKNLVSSAEFLKIMIAQFKNFNLNIAIKSPLYQNANSKLAANKQKFIDILSTYSQALPLFNSESFMKWITLNQLLKIFKNSPESNHCASITDHILIDASGAQRDCTVFYENQGVIPGDKTEWINQYQANRKRMKNLVLVRKCENECLAPCERYVHNLRRLINPVFFLKQIFGYFTQKSIPGRST